MPIVKPRNERNNEFNTRREQTLSLCLQVFGDRKAVLARELTKLHETFHRGKLSELTKLTDLKGEMVLIIEGCKQEKKQIDINELINEVDELIKNGNKTKQAVNEIAEKYKYSKNVLYNEYIKNK